MADTIPNGQLNPIIIYGRAPNGVLQAATTDGNGNLNIGGAASVADTISNTVPRPVMWYGRAPNGQLQAATTDGNGNLL